MSRRPLPVVLVELDLDAGLDYYSDTRYIDTGAGVVAKARLAKKITFKRRLTTIFWGGGRSGASIGEIQLINNDGQLDWMIGLRDVAVRILIGDESTSIASMTVVAIAIIERAETVGETTMRLVTSSHGAKLSRAVQVSLYSAGNQIGRPRPRIYGVCWSVPALPTDIANLRFSVHDSSSHTISTVKDRGVTLTSLQWALYNVAPHHGFRLNQATAGRIVADVVGPVVNFSYAFTPGAMGNVVEQLLNDAGWSAFSAAEINTLQTELGTSFQVGFFVDGAVTFEHILDGVADSMGGFWYIDRLAQFRIGRLKLPSGTPVLALTETHLVGEVDQSFDAMPGLTTSICGVRNWHVHSTDELAGSVRDTAAGIQLTQDYRSRTSFTVHAAYGSAGASVGASREFASASIRRSDPSPGSSGARRVRSDVGHGTLLSNSVALGGEATRRQTLAADPRFWYRGRFELDRTEAATLDPDQVLSLSVYDRATGLPRYGLDERLLRVVEIEGEVGESEVKLVLWGEGEFAVEELEEK